MPRDLSDAFAWIRRIVFRLDRLEGGAMLENASITDGRLRFIGGLLRVDSGGRVEIVGTLQVDGESTVTGQFTVEGPWALKGTGEITGDVSITGDLELLDHGVFRSANVRIEDGKIYVGTGANQIVIDGATGRITAGNLTIDPSSNGGSVQFSGGPEVYASGGMLAMYSTSAGAFIELGSAAKINGPGARFFEIDGSGFQFAGLPTITETESGGHKPGAMYLSASGQAFMVVPD